MVRFQSLLDSQLITTAEIQLDGTFILSTVSKDQRVKGAPAGQFRVTIVPPAGGLQSVDPVVLRAPYTVIPGENDFRIEIDRPRKWK
jgi:hypothetical protein